MAGCAKNDPLAEAKGTASDGSIVLYMFIAMRSGLLRKGICKP